MIPVHGITIVGAGLALPIGTFLRRRAQQAAPLRFGCRNDKPRCYPHHPGRAEDLFGHDSDRALDGVFDVPHEGWADCSSERAAEEKGFIQCRDLFTLGH